MSARTRKLLVAFGLAIATAVVTVADKEGLLPFGLSGSTVTMLLNSIVPTGDQ